MLNFTDLYKEYNSTHALYINPVVGGVAWPWSFGCRICESAVVV